MDTNENKRESQRHMDTNENKNENRSINAMNRFNQILEDYEDIFGQLPQIPKGGSYSTIADLMEDALISKKPLTWDDVINSFADIECDLVAD